MTEPSPTTPAPAPRAKSTAPRRPGLTTERIGQLHEDTRPLLAALQGAVEVQAARRGDKAVPAETLADARAVLADVRRVLTHEPGRRNLFYLHGPLTWAGLNAKLELALTAFRQFRDTYDAGYDEEIEGRAWLTPEYLELRSIRAEMKRASNDLDEDDENLSTLDDDDL